MPEDERNEEAPENARENVNEPAAGHETAPGTEPSATEPGEAPGDAVAAAALEHFDGLVFHDSRGQAVLYVPRDLWIDVARWLHDDHGFEVCVDVCGVDHLLNARRPTPEGVTPERFEVVANLLSRFSNRRLRLICEVPASDPVVASLADVYPGADWPERETYDMFGIRFDGHPDLTRILMPEDWRGWPLRKDDAPARVPVQFKGPSETPFQQARTRSGGEAT